jgi:translocation protein SEC62
LFQTEKPKKKKKSKAIATNSVMAAATGQLDVTPQQQKAYEAPKVEELADDE